MQDNDMLVFILLTTMMSGVVLLSASFFYLNNQPISNMQQTSSAAFNNMDVRDKLLEQPKTEVAAIKTTPALLDLTRTSHTSNKQLPLLGMPDKAFYRIH